MSKFKVGDRVRRVKGGHEGMQINDESIVTEANSYYINLMNYKTAHDPAMFELVEDVFKHGEEVEVRDSNTKNWVTRIFIAMNPHKGSEYKYVVADNFVESQMAYCYKECRKPKEKIEEWTLQEIANAINVPVKNLRIKDN